MNITTILPISRTKYLDRVIESLQNQTYKPNNLVVIFDGSEENFVEVRNKLVNIDFGYDSLLCVKSNNNFPGTVISERRVNITNIHNQFKDIIEDTDWVFSIEDDGILPANALEKLVETVKSQRHVGMVTGVELGRWGVPYVGAWRVDDVFETKGATSMESRTGEDLVEQVDACGLYCALIRAKLYKSHVFTCQNGLGPDVNLGLFMRRRGFYNYINWNIPVTHLASSDIGEVEIKATDDSKVVKLTHMYDSIWQSSR